MYLLINKDAIVIVACNNCCVIQNSLVNVASEISYIGLVVKTTRQIITRKQNLNLVCLRLTRQCGLHCVFDCLIQSTLESQSKKNHKLVRKLKRCFKEPVCFIIFYQTKKLSSFCSNKDPNPTCLKSHVIY